MKKLKRFACLFLAAALMIMCLPMPFRASAVATTVASGECGTNATWVLDSDGILTITGTGEVTGTTASYEWAWEDCCEQIKVIVIDEGVTAIGAYALDNLVNVTSVNFPNSLTEIGSNAFYGCHSLENVVIPSGVETVGINAFGACHALKSVYISDGVKTIEMEAFGACAGLISVFIPKSVATIESNAFWLCSSLNHVFTKEQVMMLPLLVFQAIQVRLQEDAGILKQRAFRLNPWKNAL